MALVAGTIAARALGLDVETIGTRFGGIPSGLPSFHLPQFRPELIPGLIVPAMTVAMLGAIESLMSAMVADHMCGDRHDSNVELVAQGIANIASPLFGGLPATGAIARTATNIRNGAKTPVAGIVHALTEFADLTQAVGVGMVCAALLFIKRVADTTTVSPVTDEYVQEGHVHILQNKIIPPYVKIYRIHGPFLFGATGLRAVEELAETLHRSGRHLVLCGARHQPASLIARADFHWHVGDANICRNLEEALTRARDIHGQTRMAS